MSDGTLSVEELNADNIVAANTLSLKPGQEQFVAPVSHSISEAYVNQQTMWPRVIVRDGDVVAFTMANFDEGADDENFRCLVMRLNVAAELQGQGIGTFALRQIAREAKARGFTQLTSIWEDGELGPGPFFRAFGFEDTGLTRFGEQVGRYDLSRLDD